MLSINDKSSANLPKVGDQRNRTWLRFCLTLNDKLGVNLPKVGDPRNQTWPRFCLTLDDKLNAFSIKTIKTELNNTSDYI